MTNTCRSNRARRSRRSLVAVMAMWLFVIAGCSGDADDLSADPLSRRGFEELTGLKFPASVDKYRSTQDSTGTLSVTCTIAADDVSAFDSASDLGLRPGRRVIVHASPLWDLNPDGDIAGAQTEIEGVRRQVEVVTRAGADVAEVRVSADLAPDAA